MLKLLGWLVSKAGWLLLSFVAVVALLALWNEIPTKLRAWQAQATDTERAATQLSSGAPVFEQDAQNAVRDADAKLAELKMAGDAQLVAAEKDIATQRREANGRILDKKAVAWAAATGASDKIVASYRAQYIELPLLDRATELIKLRQSNLKNMAAKASLKRQVAKYNTDVGQFNKEVAKRNGLQRDAARQQRNPLCRRADVLPGCSLVREIRERDLKLQNNRQALSKASAAIKRRKTAVNALTQRREQVADGKAIVATATAAYSAEAQRMSAVAAGHTLNRAWAAFRSYGWKAGGIILGALLLPIIFKLFAYLIIGPLAARTQPVRLRASGPMLTAGAAGISVEVPIDAGSELLLRSGLQSSATDVRGSDMWVLDWRMLFTCLAAGLVKLQRLRTNRPDNVVVTGTDDHHWVVPIAVPVGGAVVMHPRALLGVVKPRRQRLTITRPWRVFWLISWITVQFRYVVFHGPCTLIIQGHSGIQVEDAANGRMIDKRLTLGFDAGLDYGAARSASFFPYLGGRVSLFNDRFGGTGRYFYEQRAAGPVNGSLWGRGLKGIGDGLLSAFGI